MLGQPGFELAIGADFLLQRLERLQTGGQVGQASGLVVHHLLAVAAVFVQQGHLFLQLLQAGVGLGCCGLGLGQLFGQLGQAGLVGRRQGIAIGLQALAPLVQLARLLFCVALFGRQHLDLLLHLHNGTPLFIGLVLGLAQGLFELRQGHGLVLDLGRQRHALVFGHDALFGQRVQLALRLFAALLPLRDLLLQLHQPLFGALTPLHHKADFGFELAHFGTGFVELALGLVDLVTGRVVRLADGFQIGLDMAQIGHARLQRVDGLVHIDLHLALVTLGFAAFQEPQLVLLEGAVGLQVVVALGHFGLLFEFFEVGVELAQDAFHPGQVFAGVGQSVFGLAAAFLVFGHARSFFEEQAQFFGARLDDSADRALTDDGVSTRPQACAQKHVLHIAAADRLVVDVVAAVAVTGQHALDRDLGKLAPLATGAVVGVVKHQLHAGTAGRFAAGGAVEDDVLHGLATQLGRLGLAQHPAHRVHDVGFAATVGTDHTHQLPGQHEVGRFGERFEARKLDGIETHGDPKSQKVLGMG